MGDVVTVQQTGPYRMPQPEQWLAEHPVAVALAMVFASLTAILAWRLA